jgi:5-methyltetrahydrofolate--homocysteine methyltransferase
MHGLEDQVQVLNKAAAENARAEADAAPHLVAVAGSIGPSGQMLEPLGPVSFEEAKEAFAEQAAALEAGGVDAFWVETMSDLKEARAAIEGVRSVSDLPVVATMSFDTHGHTMMGVSPEQAVDALKDFDLAAIGANCGTGSDELQEAIREMRAAHPDVLLVAKANAGIPKTDKDGNVFFDGSPDVMAEYAVKVHKLGADLIGGCCGNTPEHIQAMAQALDLPVPGESK